MDDKIAKMANICTVISAIVSFIGLLSSNNSHYIIIVLAMIIFARIIVAYIYKTQTSHINFSYAP